MTAAPPDRFIAVSVGAALRHVREQARRPLKDVAQAARWVGLTKWTTSVVSQLERGLRYLTVDEWGALPKILKRLTGSDYRLELVATADPANPGHARLIDPEGNDLLQALQAPLLDLAPLVEYHRTLMGEPYRAWPEITEPVLAAAKTEQADDPVVKIARRWDVDPLTVAIAARKLWGRGFSEERDGRVAEASRPTEAGASATRALRGHATRAMLGELKPVLEAARRPARTARRRPRR